MSDVDSRQPPLTATSSGLPELQFIVELPPRFGTFAANLRAAWGRAPQEPGPGGDFWPDVLVARRFPRGGVMQSICYHLLVMAAIFGISKLPRPPHVTQAGMFDHTAITYYSVSDELPPIEAPPEPARESRPADPLPARQEVMSLPRNPESFRQRIITPDPTPLKTEQPLPNLMAWVPAPPAAPVASGARNLNSVWRVLDRNQVVAPPAESGSSLPTGAEFAPRAAVPPPPDSGAGTQRDLELPVRVAVAPPVNDVSAGPTDRSLILQPRAAVSPIANDTGAPIGPLTGADPVALAGRTALPPAPPAPARVNPGAAGDPVAGGGAPAFAPVQGSRQAIVVGLNPAAPNGALDLPRGNLNGAFAGSPNGRPDATGVPATIAGGNGRGGAGTNKNSDGPSGLIVRGSPAVTGAPVVVVAAPRMALPTPEPPSNPVKKPNMFAMRRPSTEYLARATAPNNTAMPDAPVESQVFHTRHFYSMILNMPNFTSASGSWVIRFAAADPKHADDDLEAPVALVKVDPAYPVELMKAGVEGNVTLYAVIRADGSVGDVRVLRGLNDRLDEFARVALSAWKFQPAMRHGSAVDLDAVVQIPFHPAPARQIY